jgi:hypothetical protein
MTAATLTTRRIVGSVVAVLFVFGFVMDWVSADRGHVDFSEKREMKYAAKKRKDEMKTKKYFHEKFFEILDADIIGENLRQVIS